MSGQTPTNSGFDPQIIKGEGGISVSGAGTVIVSAGAGGDSAMVSAVRTLAELAALKGPEKTTVCEVDQVAALYRWTPGSLALVDNWLTLRNLGGGTAGRWTLIGDQISIAPSGADDWPNIFGPNVGPGNGGLVAAAAGRATVRLRAGRWHANTFFAGSLASNTVMIGSPEEKTIGSPEENTVIVAAMTTGGGEAPFHGALGFPGGATTLSLANTPGTNVLQTVGGLTVGARVQVRSGAGAGARIAYYTVLDSSAGVGFTITVDRPVLDAFAPGDTVTVVTQPTSITLRDMLVIGTADHAIYVEGAEALSVSRVNYGPGDGLDVLGVSAIQGALGGLDLRIDQVRIYGSDFSSGTRVPVGIELESHEGSLVSRCNVLQTQSKGISLLDAAACVVEQCTVSTDSGQGIALDANGNGTGCVDCLVSACTLTAQVGVSVGVSEHAAVTGCAVSDATIGYLAAGRAARITGCSSENAGTGIDVTGADTLVTGYSHVQPGVNGTGIMIEALAVGTKISNATLVGGNNGVDSAIGFDAENLEVRGPQNAGVNIAAAATADDVVLLKNYRYTGSNVQANHGVAVSSFLGRVRVDSAEILLRFAGSAAYLHQGSPLGVFELAGDQHVRQSVVGCLGYAQGAAATGTLRRQSGRYDLNVTTPLTIDAAGFCSDSADAAPSRNVVMAGAPVNYAFPDLKATDFVTITKVLNGGTSPSGAPAVTLTPGVQVVITPPSALDTSTYRLQIDG